MICPYCGIDTKPHNYHEGPQMCVEALKKLRQQMAEVIYIITTTPVSHEMDPEGGVGCAFGCQGCYAERIKDEIVRSWPACVEGVS